MEESATYQATVRKGEAIGFAKGLVRGARKVVLRQGAVKFGKPDAATRRALNAMTDIQQLEKVCERMFMAESWQELLAETRRCRRTGRRKTGR